MTTRSIFSVLRVKFLFLQTEVLCWQTYECLNIQCQTFCTFSFQSIGEAHNPVKYACHHCSSVAYTKREASRHARKHIGNPYFRMACPVCKQMFTSVWGWSRHLNVHDFASGSSGSTPHLSGSCTSPDTEGSTSQETSQDLEVPSPCSSGQIPVFDSRKELASLIVRLRAKNVTEGSCKDVVEFVRTFTSHGISEYEKNRQDASTSSGDDSTSDPNIHCLRTCDAFMRSDHIEAVAMKEFDSVEPEAVTIGTDESGCAETVHYVSLVSQLTKCLEEHKFTSFIMSPSASTDELQGLQDGSIHQYSDNETLLLSLYYDSFQSGNPLGNKAKQHSLGAVYCSIANAHYRGKLDDVLFLLLFQEMLLKSILGKTS